MDLVLHYLLGRKILIYLEILLNHSCLNKYWSLHSSLFLGQPQGMWVWETQKGKLLESDESVSILHVAFDPL